MRLASFDLLTAVILLLIINEDDSEFPMTKVKSRLDGNQVLCLENGYLL